MFVVGGFMLLSGVLMVLARTAAGGSTTPPDAAPRPPTAEPPSPRRTGPMTRLFNDPADFADEMIDGFVAAHADLVRRVPGGVVRSSPAPDGQVAVVIGGGSGHYPAFAGLVGQGLAHGAAMGNIFASPSAQQVHSVARPPTAAAGCCCATATTPATC